MNVLIVEDDESVANFLEQAMVEAGHDTRVVADGRAASETAIAEAFDLIMLDVMLPGMSGLDVCRQLRTSGAATPIMIVTARDTLEDIVEGLDSGADDYIVKPFRLDELLSRTRALLRRSELSPHMLCVADLTLDPATRRATRGGQSIGLSATEYALLEYLMRNAGQALTRSSILAHVWPSDFEGNENVLEVYISYLRRKIDKNQEVQLIQTVRGIGYRMVDCVV